MSKILWASWDKCCGTLEEGALSCKSMSDLAYSFSFKLWFNLRAKLSLWAKFMVKWAAEPSIVWGLGAGNIFFWQDRLLNGHIRNVIPSLILWYLWMERNNSRFNDVTMDHQRIIYNVNHKIGVLFTAKLLSIKSFKHCLFAMEGLGIRFNVDYNQRIPRSIVWLKPCVNFFKLNVDIVNINNVWACGGLTQDSNGNYILGFIGPISNCDGIFAINYAILYGIRLYLALDLINLVVEDKGNACANSIAKWGCGFVSMVDLPVSNLPRMIIGLLGLDKIRMFCYAGLFDFGFWIVFWWVDLSSVLFLQGLLVGWDNFDGRWLKLELFGVFWSFNIFWMPPLMHHRMYLGLLVCLPVFEGVGAMMALSSSNPWLDAKEDGKSRYFKEVLAGFCSAIGGKINFAHGSFKGCPALMIDDNDISKLAAPFAFTLVGKFVGRRPNLDIIHKFFVNLKLSGTFSVGLLDQRHVAIQLANDLDYSRIFARRTYYIFGCQMRLLKWTPDFDVSKESPIAPVWISFPNLRLHFFNQQILFALASIFGRPLQIDQATAAVSRPSVTRVLVEMDISRKHPKEVWIGSELNGYQQKVELENFPVFCGFCKMHGHANSECLKLHPHLRKLKETQEDGQGSKNVVSQPVQGLIPEQMGNADKHLAQGEGTGAVLADTCTPVVEVQTAEKLSKEPLDVMLAEHNNRPTISHLIVPKNNNLIDTTLDKNVSFSLAQDGDQVLEEGEPERGELVVDLVDGNSNFGNEAGKVSQASVVNLPLNDTNINLNNIEKGNGDDEGRAQLFFWQDQWLGSRSIDSLLNTVSNATTKVDFFLSDNGWDQRKLSAILPHNVVDKILNLPMDLEKDDMLICDFAHNGLVNIMDAWQNFRLKDFKIFHFAAPKFGINVQGNLVSKNQKLVYWHKPPCSIFKLNVDGSVKGDAFGCGGIIRDDKGNLVLAFVGPLDSCTVVKAELLAILNSIKLYFLLDIFNIWIEVDATSTIHFIMEQLGLVAVWAFWLSAFFIYVGFWVAGLFLFWLVFGYFLVGFDVKDDAFWSCYLPIVGQFLGFDVVPAVPEYGSAGWSWVLCSPEVYFVTKPSLHFGFSCGGCELKRIGELLTAVTQERFELKNFLNCYDAVLYFGIRHNGNFSNGNQRLVYWHKPPVSIFKLNVDGSVRNDGFGCGGIIRDDKGNLVVAFAEPLPTCSVVKAELFAILKGIKLCFSRDIYNIWIEVDAISTIHFLMQNSSNVVKHDLFYLIREIKHLLNMANCNMSHVYREGNACADWLANFGCNLSCFTEFSTDNLPLPVKGMIRLDKLNMPYLRK
ncbi:hypothetical protein M5K25_000189 [Dendrobium thyrsiflorum]|uniref:RNase H type-1 domain-containing protein n=1 Tax=Dendrobium thyrsiflorum TaxID=117978 RepID=A0ABD0VT82_DENTH